MAVLGIHQSMVRCIMEPISGRESSILALLAQSRGSLTGADTRRILAALDGRALQIAKAIVGTHQRPSQAVQTAADGFIAWAQSLPRR